MFPVWTLLLSKVFDSFSQPNYNFLYFYNMMIISFVLKKASRDNVFYINVVSILFITREIHLFNTLLNYHWWISMTTVMTLNWSKVKSAVKIFSAILYCGKIFNLIKQLLCFLANLIDSFWNVIFSQMEREKFPMRKSQVSNRRRTDFYN